MGEAAHLPDDIVAERAVMMAARAEAHAIIPPFFIIGTEIPTPGGAMEALDHLAPTTSGIGAGDLPRPQSVFPGANPSGLGARDWDRGAARR